MSVYDIPFWSKDFYDHKARWIHYYNQIRAVANEIKFRGKDLKSFRVLEVGPSHGQVTSYLKKFGVDTTTIDNKKEYSPDVLGSVYEMPFPDNSFDMILICEVLEHMPYEQFPVALKELYRVTKKTVFFSAPDTRRTFSGLYLKLPFLKAVEFILKLSTRQNEIMDGHFWEIGKRDFSVSRVKADIEKAGFKILEDKVYYDTPKNHYFWLEK
ncbi:MAG: methyltransferase domain-containing protein [Candidatus Paceibacterota bacterium]|jgi:SAM-dependent methyltransferase